MQHTQTRTITVTETYVTCDRCGLEMHPDTPDLEHQERLAVRFRAGYGSVFGDGSLVELDLCQHCVKEVPGPWLRVIDDGWPKTVPHHAGQTHQRRMQPDCPDALDDFERAGVPGILLDIENTTCYDLDQAKEAYAGRFESQTCLNLALLDTVLNLSRC